jgi:HD-like signal output (HDOD) protein
LAQEILLRADGLIDERWRRMLAVAIVIAVACACGGSLWYFAHRRLPTFAAVRVAGAPEAIAVELVDVDRVETANGRATERVWRIAFTAPTEPAGGAHEHVADAIRAALRSEVLQTEWLPRRPTLMPQLLRTLEDPGSASPRLATMISHDPVLAADVLRLANSSLYRISAAPIETIQRAIVVLGVDALRGLLATAMMQPVFRATRTNFPRFPRLLWERTERAARAAELYAAGTRPADRFEAQLLTLLSALGPLVVYGVTLDEYEQRRGLRPDAAVCMTLITSLGAGMSQRIARHWESSPRLVAALEGSAASDLAIALQVGELLGTLSLLEAQHLISPRERWEWTRGAGLADRAVNEIYTQLGDGVP